MPTRKSLSRGSPSPEAGGQAVTEDQCTPQTTTIPIIKDNELRLAKMRRQLEGMFRSLELIHDEIAVVSEAARSEGQPEIAKVLSLCVCNRLFGQLKLLTNIIERLGGTTDLSEGPALVQEMTQLGETRS
jgi:hypothetical protein